MSRVLFMRYSQTKTKNAREPLASDATFCKNNQRMSVFVWFYGFMTVFKIRLFAKKKKQPIPVQTEWQPKRGGFVMNILKFNFLEEKPRTAQNITSFHWWENAPTLYFWIFTGRDENNYLETLKYVKWFLVEICILYIAHYL